MKRLVLGAVLLTLAIPCQGSEIIDNAKMFSPGCVARCKNLLQMHAHDGFCAIIETFNYAERTKFSSASDKDKFFQDWLILAAKKRDAKGVYVLICKNPGRVQVNFHQSMYARGYTKADETRIANMAKNAGVAARANGERNFDNLLAALVAALGTAERNHRRPAEAELQPVVAIHPIHHMMVLRNQNNQAVPAEAAPVVDAAPEPNGIRWIPLLVVVGVVLVIGIVCYVFAANAPKTQPCDPCKTSYLHESSDEIPAYQPPVYRPTPPSAPSGTSEAASRAVDKRRSDNSGFASGFGLGSLLDSSPSSSFDFGGGSSGGSDMGGGFDSGGFDGGSGGDF